MRGPWTRPILLTALAGAMVVGCGKPDKPDPQAKKGVKTQTTAGAKSGAPEGEVLAKIGDRVITLQEFEERLAQQSAFARGRYSSLQRKQEFLDSLVRFELLARDAEAKGFGDDLEVVLARQQAMVKLLTAKEIRDLVKLADVTDADVATYYNEHLEEFDKPAEVRASHILVETEDAAKALMPQIQTKLDAEPRKARQTFAEFVREHSKDASTARLGGDLQFFGKPGDRPVRRDSNQPMVPPAVATAVFDLEKVGAIVGPIRSSQGWHIVQKTGFRRPYKRELDDVKTSIRNKLFRVKKGKTMEDYVKGLKDGVTITIDEAVLEKAKVKPGNAPDIEPPTFKRKGPMERPRRLPGLGTATPRTPPPPQPKPEANP